MPADNGYYDAGGYASEEVRDILTTRQPNGEGVPQEGLPYMGAAGPRILGRDSGAGSAGLVFESGGFHRSAANPRDERGEMVTPTKGIIPAALAVRRQILRNVREGHSAMVSATAVA